MVETDRAAPPTPATGEGAELRRLLDEYKGVTARLVESHDTLRTQLHRVRRELEEKDRELERKKRLEALGRVAAGVAHEFRNPLGGIRLTIDTLRREHGEEALASRLDRIARAAEHLDHIVEDLMSFTRDQPLEVRPVPIGPVVDHAVELALTGVEGEVPEVLRAGDPDLDFAIDRTAFSQVLANLIDNARRALPAGTLSDGGPAIGIAWGCRRDSGGAQCSWLEIADRGPGIPAGEEERIFHPFHTLREDGTGLGLSIVHSRIEAHGGTIRVVPDLCLALGALGVLTGACFRIELPLAPEEVSP